jgi:hypothetical protein
MVVGVTQNELSGHGALMIEPAGQYSPVTQGIFILGVVQLNPIGQVVYLKEGKQLSYNEEDQQ